MINSVLCKMSKQGKPNKALQKRIAQIEALLLKGQRQSCPLFNEIFDA
jgi:hypothetical protein